MHIKTLLIPSKYCKLYQVQIFTFVMLLTVQSPEYTLNDFQRFRLFLTFRLPYFILYRSQPSITISKSNFRSNLTHHHHIFFAEGYLRKSIKTNNKAFYCAHIKLSIYLPQQMDRFHSSYY